MPQIIFRIIIAFPILLGPPLAYGQSFELFGIDILTASRSKITGAILQRGGQKLASNDQFTDRYDGSALFPGAHMKVGFSDDGKLEHIVLQFDYSWFYDILTFDEIKQNLIEKYGKPIVTAAEIRNSDFGEELKWTKSGVQIQLCSYKLFAAWRIHITHQLSYHIPTNQTYQKDESMFRSSFQRQ